MCVGWVGGWGGDGGGVCVCVGGGGGGGIGVVMVVECGGESSHCVANLSEPVIF